MSYEGVLRYFMFLSSDQKERRRRRRRLPSILVGGEK
jgi:hypothetical protein